MPYIKAGMEFHEYVEVVMMCACSMSFGLRAYVAMLESVRSPWQSEWLDNEWSEIFFFVHFVFVRCFRRTDYVGRSSITTQFVLSENRNQLHLGYTVQMQLANA